MRQRPAVAAAALGPGSRAVCRDLDQDTRELLERVVGLEQRRVFELRQHHVISVERLRECVLRDLSWLFNTASLECSELLDETPGPPLTPASTSSPPPRRA